jgi:quercetin dioxygenase-like cupin family protein
VRGGKNDNKGCPGAGKPLESSDFFILKKLSVTSESDKENTRSGSSRQKALRVGYGGTLHQRLGRNDGAPVSVWSFSVDPGFKDDDRRVWVSHTEPETVYVTSGRFHYSMVSPDGAIRDEITIKAGDLLFVAPGTYHRGHCVGDEKYEGLVFTGKGLDSELESTFTEESRLIGAKRRRLRKNGQSTAR